MTSSSDDGVSRGRAFGLLFVFFVLGGEMTRSHGLYQFYALVVVSCAVLLGVAWSLRDWGDFRDISWSFVLWGIAFWFGYELIHQHEMMYASHGVAVEYIFDFCRLAFAATVAVGMFNWGSRSQRLAIGMCGIAGVGVFASMVAVLWASPNPQIDVFTQLTEASKFLGEGMNPYPQEYPSFYGGDFGYPQGLNYPVGSLIWGTPGYWLGGDVRFGHIAAELVGCVGLWWLARDLRISRMNASLFVLAWLVFPVRFFVLEQAWIDSFIVAYLPYLFLALNRRRWLLAGVVLGLICGVKQYVAFIALLTGLYVWFDESFQKALTVAGSCGAVVALQTVPFALLDWDSFYYHVIGHYFELAPRTDALTWVAYSIKEHAYTPPSLVLGGVYFGVTAGLGWWLAREQNGRLETLAVALFVQYSVVFLFGKQAFCNYYYLLAFLALVGCVFAVGKTRTRTDAAHLDEAVDPTNY